jgi:phosphatidylglycerol:prolipoprotein diacylglycerol transferase
VNRELLHIFGPFSIQIFGLFVAIGISLFIWLLSRDKQCKKIITADKLSTVILLSIICGIAGGRILYILEEYSSMDSFLDFISVWNGGLSVLGGFIAILVIIPWYLRMHKIPVLGLFDRVAIYAPLAHAIARIGCFIAGCCYGIQTSVAWSVLYSSPTSIAPCGIFLHPTQLYSAGLLLIIFLLMRFVFDRYSLKTGSLLCIYLILTCSERFFVDFLRADHLPLQTNTPLYLFSLHQLIALLLSITASVVLIGIHFPKTKIVTS